MYYPQKIKGNKTSVFIIIFMLIMIIPTSAIILITTITNPVYGQPNQTIAENEDLLKHTRYPSKKGSRRGY